MAITLEAINWESIWNHTEEAVTSGEYFFPIEDFHCPIILTNRYCLVTVVSASSRATWRTAGYCSMIVDPGVVVYGIDTAYVESKLMFFGENLFVFPEISDSYQLLFGIKPWIKQVTIDIKRYVGPIIETYDPILEQIRDAVI